jgi:hypothetical protein
MIQDKPYWKSKTAWGAALLALLPVLEAIAKWLTGALDVGSMVNTLTMGVGGFLAVIGIRDAVGRKK